MKRILSFLVVIGVTVLLLSCKYDQNLVNGQEATVSGRIRKVGNEPFTSLVLSPSSTIDLYLIINDPDDKKEIENKIGTWQTLTGTILVETIETANHKKSFQKYSLFLE